MTYYQILGYIFTAGQILFLGGIGGLVLSFFFSIILIAFMQDRGKKIKEDILNPSII